MAAAEPKAQPGAFEPAPSWNSEARLPVLDRRRSGLLLHLGSLRAAGGALGSAGRGVVDWMVQAGFSVWQILPLGPPGLGGSPYWVRSDFAGDPQLIDLRELPRCRGGEAVHASVEAAADEFAACAPEPLRHEYEAFAARAVAWLEDYALFEALSAALGGVPWTRWPAELRDRHPRALERAREAHRAAVERVRIVQFFFDRQWQQLRRHAHGRGVRLFGDVPIYVAPDSVETWAHREQFLLDEQGEPLLVAGVPPDYFSADGQLWGNPLYDWARLRAEDFRHWRARIRRQLERLDLLRIDHFRGLAGFWAVGRGAPNAREGRWHDAPGHELLRSIAQDLQGALPLVAEDLGLITPDVEALREAFALPGMRVLQFAFDGDPDNAHLPHNHVREAIVYTGTHDNDTTLGWHRSLDAETAQRADFYLRRGGDSMADALVQAALGSVARLAVLPVQDVLSLGSEARLNTPGTGAGNWCWQLPPDALGAALAERCRQLNRAFGRA